MAYVQGFLIPVPETAKDAYLAFAAKALPFFLEQGALRVVECWGQDLPDGETTDVRKAVKAQAGETVVFSWIHWPDKATADAAHEAIFSDPRMEPDGPIPFDGKRMIFGGFVPILDSDVG